MDECVSSGRLRVGVLFPLLLLITSSLFPDSGGAATRESDTKRECAICHVTWMKSPSGGRRVPQPGGWNPVPINVTLGVVSNDDMCYSCHDGFVRDSRSRVWQGKGHSVGKAPSDEVQLPVTFPLNAEGRVYCGTCHTPHGVGEQTAELTSSVFLRVENIDSQLCKVCHARKLGSPRLKNHPVDVPGKKPVPQKVHALGGRLGSDPKKVICQSCHTPHGKTTLVASVNNSRLCFFCHQDKDNRGKLLDKGRPLHPVHVKVPEAMTGDVKKSIASRSGSRLGSRDEIECQSCHGMHRGRERSLVLSGGKDDLCVGCHQDMSGRMAQSKHNLEQTAPLSKNRLGQSPQRSGSCRTCHLAHGWAPKGVKNRASVSEVCLRCHTKSGAGKKKQVGEHSHPVGLKPKHFPQDSPLKLVSSGQEQVVGCHTCHDPHIYDPDPEETVPPVDQDGDFSNSFLRLTGKELCRQCHADHFSVENTKHDLARAEVKGAQEEQRRKVREEGVCLGCHRVHNGENHYLWSLAPYPSPDIGGQLCGGCHAEGKCGQEKKVSRFAHPVGVPLDEGMKTELPLYDRTGTREGEVVACFSCHDPHRWTTVTEQEGIVENRFKEGDPLNSFLRLPNDSKGALCLSCHPDKSLVAGTDHDMRFFEDQQGGRFEKLSMEDSVCRGCHRPHSDDESKKLWTEGMYGDGVEVKRACFGCHHENGRAGGKILHTVHPLSQSEESEDQLTLSLIIGDEVVQVPVGMTCRSCHNPHQWSSEKSETAVNSYGKEGDGGNSFLKMPTLPDGRLCLNCHRDKASVIRTKHDLRLLMKEEGRIAEEVTARIQHGGPCFSCHMVHNSKTEKYLWAYDLRGGQSLAEKMCFSCHSKGNAAKNKIPRRHNHPQVLLKPSLQKAKIPPDLTKALEKCLLYDDQGSIACFTCHNPHRWEAEVDTPWKGKSFNESAKNRFLRVRNDQHVCKVCHGPEGLYRYLYFHQWDRISSKE